MIYTGLISVLMIDKEFKLENHFFTHKVKNSNIPLELRINFKTNEVIFFSTELLCDVSSRLKKLEKLRILEELKIRDSVKWEDWENKEEENESKELAMEKTLAKEMIDKFGEDAQLDIVVEELSELIKEVIKYKRTKKLGEPYDINHMAEELADAYVVADIVQEVLNSKGISKEEVQKIVDYKKNRTRERYLK